MWSINVYVFCVFYSECCYVFLWGLHPDKKNHITDKRGILSLICTTRIIVSDRLDCGTIHELGAIRNETTDDVTSMRISLELFLQYGKFAEKPTVKNIIDVSDKVPGV